MDHIKRYHHELRLMWTKKLVGNGSVLDVGCSDASLLSIFDNKIKAGIDINKDQIKKNKQNYKDIDFFTENINKINFKKKFDNVVCCEVLEHLKNPDHAIKGLSNVCKKNLIISVPTHNSLLCIKKYYDNPQANLKSGHIQRYTLKKIKNNLNIMDL